ncbi:hypothetical protein BKP45_15985 [Anaerobacillus alkalidiazotrophicus]|uniref:Uncharacterized protein n=1 Tax=Anaerobacillus alkalidiazotrophicus TaxID=472963 RepID=A0A1S2M1S6_9BACI|nr:hypothetical protein [Anaerobacillus alkalidiazotrophicus]OIJ18692.1 hypothetical protein BKP45_15985 [Anaerobacillus alkalidiazotrophicus]
MEKILIILISIGLLVTLFAYISKSAIKSAVPLQQYRMKGQFAARDSSFLLPVSPGTFIFTIDINKGKGKLVHGAFNPDGATWLHPPTNRPSYYDLNEGKHELKIDIQTSFGEVDRIEIVNPHYFKELVFSYDVKTIELYEEEKPEKFKMDRQPTQSL